MILTDEEKVEAYELATHQLINAMINVRHYVTLAKQGEIDLTDSDILLILERIVFNEKIDGSMTPLVTYKKRKENQTDD